jgi:general secretion pathway protein D
MPKRDTRGDVWILGESVMSAHWYRFPAAIFGLAVVFLSGCIDLAPPEPEPPIPTFPPKPPEERSRDAQIIGGPKSQTPPKTRVTQGETPPVTATITTTRTIGIPPSLAGGQAEALSLEQVNLRTFIDEVFSKALKLTVQVDNAVATRTDLVTLRTGTTLPADELFRMGQKVLAGYGIGVSWDGDVLHIAPDNTLMTEMPDLIRSRALPEVPAALRPIFQFVDLHEVSQSDMLPWLQSAFGNKIRLFPSQRTNSIMIFGLPGNVQAAVQAVHVLDQARLAGRQSLRIAPVFWTAQGLTNKLVDLLRAEGYDAGASVSAGGAVNAITIVPVESDNSLIVFTADPAIMAHVEQWATDLDQPSKADPLRSIFVYQVQNTTADSLGPIVQSVLGQQQTPARAAPEARLEQTGQTGAQASGAAQSAGPQAAALAAPSSGGTSPRMVLDSARNALVFVGTAQEYQNVRPLLDALDQAPREALIEVTVAELTLDDTTNLGVEWTLINDIGHGLTQSLGTGTNVNLGSSGAASGLPLGTSGFNYAILNSASQVRVLLNAFSENDHLSVLSTPRVLAKSGGEASIDVGTEVPIVTSQATTSSVVNAGTSGILQSIEYRKTGVLLTVSPVVHSSDRVDLTISQEVSAALPNSTPGISSPLIQNRNVRTELSLNDGATVVIGGMIQDQRTADDTGVPFLKDVPGLGLLFRNQAVSRTKTELLVFITPYIVSNGADAAGITKTFRDQLEAWPVPSTELHW